MKDRRKYTGEDLLHEVLSTYEQVHSMESLKATNELFHFQIGIIIECLSKDILMEEAIDSLIERTEPEQKDGLLYKRMGEMTGRDALFHLLDRFQKASTPNERKEACDFFKKSLDVIVECLEKDILFEQAVENLGRFQPPIDNIEP